MDINDPRNIDNSRSYFTEQNLEAALKKMRLDDVRHIVVKNRDNRFTAIFSASHAQQNVGLVYPANQGFKVLN